MSVPSLILPAYNRHDLLLRTLRSIDVPVERGVIVDSGRNLVSSELNGQILDECERLHLWPFTPPFTSMGYGGGINFGIMQTADAPWWLWVSNDVHFEPGHLQTVIDRMEGTHRRRARLITGGFTWGAVSQRVIDSVGLIDEFGFFPIYFDDNDYHYRCKLADVEWIEDATGWSHGEGQHVASLTIKSDPHAERANGETFPKNYQEYLNKWGGPPGQEVFTTPWNSGMPVWVTRPSASARSGRQW